MTFRRRKSITIQDDRGWSATRKPRSELVNCSNIAITQNPCQGFVNIRAQEFPVQPTFTQEAKNRREPPVRIEPELSSLPRPARAPERSWLLPSRRTQSRDRDPEGEVVHLDGLPVDD